MKSRIVAFFRRIFNFTNDQRPNRRARQMHNHSTLQSLSLSYNEPNAIALRENAIILPDSSPDNVIGALTKAIRASKEAKIFSGDKQ